MDNALTCQETLMHVVEAHLAELATIGKEPKLKYRQVCKLTFVGRDLMEFIVF